MVNPFQIQSMVPEFSSISLESQLIGFLTSSQPRLSHTSWARSRSNPTYSPLSSLYPNGGYSASNPTISVLSSTPACTLTPVTIIPIVIAAAITTATVLFFMIVLLFFVIPLSRGHSTTRKRMVIVPYQKGAVKSKPSAVPDNLCISALHFSDRLWK